MQIGEGRENPVFFTAVCKFDTPQAPWISGQRGPPGWMPVLRLCFQVLSSPGHRGEHQTCCWDIQHLWKASCQLQRALIKHTWYYKKKNKQTNKKPTSLKDLETPVDLKIK